MPSVHSSIIKAEGKFTREGGGLSSFGERVNTLQEIMEILDACFGTKQRIDLTEFKRITEEVTSDMVLSLLSLFRERLPCSENYWRYKRNYELHMKILSGGDKIRPSSPQAVPNSNLDIDINEDAKSDGGNGGRRLLAQAHMRSVMPLSPYNQAERKSEGSFSNRSPPMSPSNFPQEQINIDNLKSNNNKE